MDIPRVLEVLHPTLEWGAHAGSAHAYAAFAATWPPGNPPIPTEAAMLLEWAIIQASDAADPQDTAELETRLNAYITNPAKAQEVLVAYLLDAYKSNPGRITDLGLSI